jgi:DNA polymerase III epsilon subunit family exonuclease
MVKDDIKFVVDLETTGLDFRREKIIEVAAVKLLNDEIVDTFETLVNPMQHIRNSSINIHGINEEMILEAPTIDEVLPELLDFIEDKPLIGHNVIFDYSYINYASLVLYGKELKNKRIDTLKMFKEVFPEERSHGLEALLNRFKVKLETHHRAMADAYGLAQVYGKLRALYEERFTWQLQQLDNINYLFERYLRLQALIQTLQSEMGDIKSVFKIYFEEGGVPIEASMGELLTYSTRQCYQYDLNRVRQIVEEYNLTDRLFKINVGLLDRMAEGTGLDEHIREKLLKARVNLTEQSSVVIQKPDKHNGS